MYTFGQTSPTLLFAYVLYGCTKRKDYNHRHSTAKQKAESREQRAERKAENRVKSYNYKHSRGRRNLKNLFGILSVYFETFFQWFFRAIASRYFTFIIYERHLRKSVEKIYIFCLFLFCSNIYIPNIFDFLNKTH